MVKMIDTLRFATADGVLQEPDRSNLMLDDVVFGFVVNLQLFNAINDSLVYIEN